MDEAFDKAIDLLLSQVARPGANSNPDNAQKMSQAVLNLAHAKAILEGKAPKKPGAGA